jgi:hypothetical protein
VRASLLVPGLPPVLVTGVRLETGLDAVLDVGLAADLAADFAAGLPLGACPLCRPRAAVGLALRAPFA